MEQAVFKLVDRRYAVNGYALRDARLRLGLTLKEVAAACGWSEAWQCRLEHGAADSVNETTAFLLSDVLKFPKPSG